MLGTGSITKLMVAASTSTSMDQFTMANGFRISSTAKALKRGKTAPVTKEPTKKGASRAKASSPGEMAPTTLVTSLTMTLKDMGDTHGATVESTREIGCKTRCTVMECSPTLTAVGTKASTKTIRRVAQA